MAAAGREADDRHISTPRRVDRARACREGARANEENIHARDGDGSDRGESSRATRGGRSRSLTHRIDTAIDRVCDGFWRSRGARARGRDETDIVGVVRRARRDTDRYGRSGGPDPREARFGGGGSRGDAPYGRNGPAGPSGVGARGGNGTRVISSADPRARRAQAGGATAGRGPGPGPGPAYGGGPAGPGQFNSGPPAYGGAQGGPPPPPPAVMGGQRFGAGAYGAAPPQQYAAPPQQYAAPPQQYAAPPQQYGAPPAQYGAPPAQYGAPPAYGGLPGPPQRAPVGAPLMDPNAITEYIMCPPESAGKVIGHGGEKINGIQSESGAVVKIQNQSDVGPGQPRRVTISGLPDRVAHASQLVYALIGDSGARRAAPRGAVGAPATAAPQTEVFVPVESTDFGKIIGRGGDTIRRLQEESGARMQVDRPNSGVLITGDASGCEVARTLLQEVLDAQDDRGGGPSSSIISIEIDAQGQEGRIIGKGGENIRSLSQQTGAKLQIIKETGMLKISGTQEVIDEAVRVVNEFIEAQQSGGPRGGPAGIPGDGGGAQAYLDSDKPGLVKYKPLWETHQSPEGYTYYYNTTTGETQWEEPDDYDGFS